MYCKFDEYNMNFYFLIKEVDGTLYTYTLNLKSIHVKLNICDYC